MNTEDIHNFEKSRILSLSNNSSGTRIATATSDNQISFFTQDINNQNNMLPEPLKISLKSTPIKIKFAPAEYGSLIGISDADGTLYLYEESIEKISHKTKCWNLVYQFDFPSEKIQDFKFSPYISGYNLAIGTSFGVLRIYKCSNNLEFKEWELKYQDIVTSNIKGVKSLTWCKNPFYNLMIAVAYESEKEIFANKLINTSDIALYMNNGENWKIIGKLPDPEQYLNFSDDICWAANLGKTFESVVSCGKDGIFLWIFYIDGEKLIIKDSPLRINSEMGLCQKVSWSSNSNSFICMNNDKIVFLIKELNDEWQCVYIFQRKEKRGIFD